MSAEAGSKIGRRAPAPESPSRGFRAAPRWEIWIGDLDKDGSLEVVMNHLNKRRSLPKTFVTKKNWLLIPYVGTTANRDGDRDRCVRLCG